AWGVELEVDGFLGGVGVEEQQLGDNDVRYFVFDRRAKEHDAVHEQPAENVVRSLAAARALDDVGRVDRAHRHGDSTVDCDKRKVKTFSSVSDRSTSRSRFAFSSEARSCSAGMPRRPASSR